MKLEDTTIGVQLTWAELQMLEECIHLATPIVLFGSRDKNEKLAVLWKKLSALSDRCAQRHAEELEGSRPLREEVCEVCGEPATNLVQDVDILVFVDHRDYSLRGRPHAFCRTHSRESVTYENDCPAETPR